MERKIVHVVGTGTIGEPLIGILCEQKSNLGIDEVTFHKQSPLTKDTPKIKNLIAVIGGSDNLGSISIHKKNGFKYIGTLSKVGYKKNKWVDSVYMQKKL